MVEIHYCDKCGKQIAGDNEFGQVMAITLKIQSDNRHDNGIIDGSTEFCSASCAVEYLKSFVDKENEWLDCWKRGKILGVAPKKPEKVGRR